MFCTFVPPIANDVPGIFHAESAAETAAFLDVRQFAVGQASNALEQFHRLFGRAPIRADHGKPMCMVHLCGNVASVSVTPSISCRNSVNSNTRRPMPTMRGSGSACPKNTRHIAETGARRTDNPSVRLKHIAEMMDHTTRFVPITRIERRLAATRLFTRIDRGHAVAFQQPSRRLGDAREKLIDVAGNKQGYWFAGDDTAGRPAVGQRFE